MDALLLHRIHFAFTITYHYLFPQLTMGLALLIVVLKTIAIRRKDERYNEAARFWARIFGINFVLGVVTGIPMEFQFGTNWSHFSRFAGGVIGQTLAMEGVYSFFLESSFLGLFLFGEKMLGRIGHWLASIAVFAGDASAAGILADFDFDATRGRPQAHRIERFEIAVILGRLAHFENRDRVEHFRFAVGDADHRAEQGRRRPVERGLQGRGAAEHAFDALDACVPCAVHQLRQNGGRREHSRDPALREQGPDIRKGDGGIGLYRVTAAGAFLLAHGEQPACSELGVN